MSIIYQEKPGEIESAWGISPELWEWCHEANVILDKYFAQNLHRYAKTLTLKEQIHREAMARKGEKARQAR